LATVTGAARAKTGARGGARSRRLADRAFHGTTLVVSLGLIGLLAFIVVVFSGDAVKVFDAFGLHFLTGRNWNPVTDEFGALPFIVGTLVTSALAIILAVPVSVGLALLLNEASTGWIRNVLAVFVDLLAAIPSVVYGLWGIFILLPIFDHHVEPFLVHTLGRVPVIGTLFAPNATGGTVGGDVFTAGVILAIMILPIVTAVTREVVAVVPRDLREAAMALGATRYEMIRMAVLPYARSGIVGATMLGLGRALGETIAVAMVIGAGLGLHVSLFNSGYTIPAVIANEFREASSAGLHKSALITLALILMVIALLVASASRVLVRRSRALVSGDTPPEELEATTAVEEASG
jgi:phosphate transport system permease protein